MSHDVSLHLSLRETAGDGPTGHRCRVRAVDALSERQGARNRAGDDRPTSRV